MKRRSSYKLTYFDKHGPDGALRLKALGTALPVLGFGLLLFAVLGGAPSPGFGLTGWRFIVFTLVGALTLFGLAMFMSLRAGTIAGDGAQHIYMGGSSTPYDDNFSLEQSLVMQRDYAGALHLYEQRILVTPSDGRLLIATADLYATLGENHKRAAELYKEVQRLTDVAPGQDIYVSNKLADLYLGKLEEPGRALVEFRRLMHRYPGTIAGKNAKSALDNLKPDLVKEQEP